MGFLFRFSSTLVLFKENVKKEKWKFSQIKQRLKFSSVSQKNYFVEVVFFLVQLKEKPKGLCIHVLRIIPLIILILYFIFFIKILW